MYLPSIYNKSENLNYALNYILILKSYIVNNN